MVDGVLASLIAAAVIWGSRLLWLGWENRIAGRHDRAVVHVLNESQARAALVRLVEVELRPRHVKLMEDARSYMHEEARASHCLAYDRSRAARGAGYRTHIHDRLAWRLDFMVSMWDQRRVLRQLRRQLVDLASLASFQLHPLLDRCGIARVDSHSYEVEAWALLELAKSGTLSVNGIRALDRQAKDLFGVVKAAAGLSAGRQAIRAVGPRAASA